jgi:hypothetical protein
MGVGCSLGLVRSRAIALSVTQSTSSNNSAATTLYDLFTSTEHRRLIRAHLPQGAQGECLRSILQFERMLSVSIQEYFPETAFAGGSRRHGFSFDGFSRLGGFKG